VLRDNEARNNGRGVKTIICECSKAREKVIVVQGYIIKFLTQIRSRYLQISPAIKLRLGFNFSLFITPPSRNRTRTNVNLVKKTKNHSSRLFAEYCPLADYEYPFKEIQLKLFQEVNFKGFSKQ
jgi:hypothetical protein